MSKLDWIGKQHVVNHTDEVLFPLLERVSEAFLLALQVFGDTGVPFMKYIKLRL